MNWKLPTLALITILCSCSNSREVVQNGPFQHRKYVNKGWFLDMHAAERHTPKKTELKGEAPVAPVLMAADVEDPVLPEASAPAERPLEPLTLALAPVALEDADTAPTLSTAAVNEPLAQVALAAGPSDGYGMRASLARKAGAATAAIPALMAPGGNEAGGINIFALLGFIFAFLFPLAGLVLSIIGLNQTSKGDGHGHGLAMAGLILSIVFLVVAVTIII